MTLLTPYIFCDDVKLCYYENSDTKGHTGQPQDDTQMNMEQRWKDPASGKLSDWKKNVPQCHYVHHKSHMHCPRRETGPLR
jgi:hypothetical protein